MTKMHREAKERMLNRVHVETISEIIEDSMTFETIVSIITFLVLSCLLVLIITG